MAYLLEYQIDGEGKWNLFIPAVDCKLYAFWRVGRTTPSNSQRITNLATKKVIFYREAEL